MPEDVIGEPLIDRPVGTVIATEVTVPPDEGLVLAIVSVPSAAGVTEMPLPAVSAVFFQYASAPS